MSEPSPNTKPEGVDTKRRTQSEVIAPLTSSQEFSPKMNADAVLENSMLQSKLASERARVRNYNEYIQNMKLKLQQKDKKLDLLQTNVDSQYKLLQNYEHQRIEMEAKIANLTKAVRTMKDTAPMKQSELAEILGKELTHEQRGKGRFEFQKQQELRYLQLLNKHKTMRRTFIEKLQIQEQACMEYEDEYAPDTMKAIFDNLKRQKEAEKAKEKEPVQRKTLIAHYEGKKEQYTLNFKEPIVLQSTDDEYAQALMNKSAFGDTLSQFKSDLGSIVKQFKKENDESLNCLWCIFTERNQLYRAKDDFFKHTKAVLQKSRIFMNDFARGLNQLVKKFFDREKAVKLKWSLERVPTTECGVSADITPPIVWDLKEEIDTLKRRITVLTSQFSQKESSLEMCAEKAETNVQFLQQQLLALHKWVLHSLKAVYKHRYKWCNKLADPLRELNMAINETRKRPQPMEITFNLSLGEVVNRDIMLLKRFADYFVGDTFFGIDMTRVKESELQVLYQRRKSFQLEPPDADDDVETTVENAVKGKTGVTTRTSLNGDDVEMTVDSVVKSRKKIHDNFNIDSENEKEEKLFTNNVKLPAETKEKGSSKQSTPIRKVPPSGRFTPPPPNNTKLVTREKRSNSLLSPSGVEALPVTATMQLSSPKESFSDRDAPKEQTRTEMNDYIVNTPDRVHFPVPPNDTTGQPRSRSKTPTYSARTSNPIAVQPILSDPSARAIVSHRPSLKEEEGRKSVGKAIDRMEEWRLKQQDLWEKKRAKISEEESQKRRHTIYMDKNVKESDTLEMIGTKARAGRRVSLTDTLTTAQEPYTDPLMEEPDSDFMEAYSPESSAARNLHVMNLLRSSTENFFNTP